MSSGIGISTDGWIDVSLPIDASSIAWEGLEPPAIVRPADLSTGDSVTVGRLSLCLHTGTHADAPSHVGLDDPTIDLLDPGRYVGRALLVRTESTEMISLDELQALGVGSSRPERLLVATPCQYDGVDFPQSVPHVEIEAAQWLVEIGVRLLGVNVPSVDPLDSQTLDSHHALMNGGVHIVENLVLSDLPPGAYDFVAVPLRIIGGDASPVRALMRPHQ